MILKILANIRVKSLKQPHTHTHTHTDCTLPFLLHDYDTNGDINIPGSNYQNGGGWRETECPFGLERPLGHRELYKATCVRN